MDFDLERLPDELKPEALRLGRRCLRRLASVVYQAELSGFSRERLEPLFEEIGLSEPMIQWVFQISAEHYEGRRQRFQEDHFRELIQKSVLKSSWTDIVAKGLMRFGLLIVGLLPAWSGGFQRFMHDMWEARFVDTILQTLGSFVAVGALFSLLMWVSEVKAMVREAQDRRNYRSQS